jgi:hypothetical protein
MGEFAFAYVMMQADWRASVALLVLLLALVAVVKIVGAVNAWRWRRYYRLNPPPPQLSITQFSACLKERYRE